MRLYYKSHELQYLLNQLIESKFDLYFLNQSSNIDSIFLIKSWLICLKSCQKLYFVFQRNTGLQNRLKNYEKVANNLSFIKKLINNGIKYEPISEIMFFQHISHTRSHSEVLNEINYPLGKVPFGISSSCCNT
ncbi:hypothetical protein BpHYR1_053978 [Brachionus plicatilis]|uniref:Uncharacterized protein n=1 Tax=Brachionus plicatilis TaxID=10195 RepID=A0A3M7PPD1_BRAPC|nr:hypothetical protein BpHYR1_053978 [Brachionus plicatilis]